MPDSTSNLIFKISIEGKEEFQVIEVAAKDIEKVKQAVTVADTSYQKLAAAALKYSEASDKNATSITEYIKLNGLNETQIRKTIETLREEQLQYAMGTEGYQRSQVAISNINAAYNNLTGKALPQVASGSNAARMMVQQLGFAMGDASMIAVDFRMFMLGIGNNLPFIVQGFAEVKKSIEGTDKTLGKLLKEQFHGPMGLVMGANAAVLALQFMPAILELIDDKSRELAEEGLKKVNQELQRLIDLQKQISGFKFSSIEQSFESQNEYNKRNIERITALQSFIKSDPLKELNMRILSATGMTDVNMSNINKAAGRVPQDVIDEWKILYGRVNDAKKEIKALQSDQNYYNQVLDATQGKLVGLNERIRTQNIVSSEWQTIISGLSQNQLNALIGSLQNTQDELKKSDPRYKTSAANMALLREEAAKLNDALTGKEPGGKGSGKTAAQIAIEEAERYQREYREKEKEWAKKYKRTESHKEQVAEEKAAELKAAEELKKELAEKQKEIDNHIAELKIEAIADEHEQALAELEKWKADELTLWGQTEEAKSLIEKVYTKKRNEILREEYQDKNKTSMAFVDSAIAGYKTMWDQLIIGGRQAKDPWDAIWLSMRNTALARLGEILQTNIFDGIINMLSGTTSKKVSGGSDDESGGFWNSIGGIIGTVVSLLKPAVNTGTGTLSLGSDAAIAKVVVDKIDGWQKNLTVINDVWDQNQKIKRVNNIIDKYTIKE